MITEYENYVFIFSIKTKLKFKLFYNNKYKYE